MTRTAGFNIVDRTICQSARNIGLRARRHDEFTRHPQTIFCFLPGVGKSCLERLKLQLAKKMRGAATTRKRPRDDALAPPPRNANSWLDRAEVLVLPLAWKAWLVGAYRCP